MGMVIATANLNVRKCGGLNCKVIAYLQEGQIAEEIKRDADWSKIIFDYGGRQMTGWAYNKYLADFSDASLVPHVPGVVYIPDDMRSMNIRAQQYIRVDGKTKYNLCGEFCAAALGHAGIDVFLAAWERKNIAFYEAFVEGDQPTGLSVVEDMLDTLAVSHERVPAPISLDDVLAYIGDSKSLLVGANIDASGQIVPYRKIPHWVVIVQGEKVINGGWVTVYNPFTNQFEFETWETVKRSMAAFGVASLLVDSAIYEINPVPPDDCDDAVKATWPDVADALAIAAESMGDTIADAISSMNKIIL